MVFSPRFYDRKTEGSRQAEISPGSKPIGEQVKQYGSNLPGPGTRQKTKTFPMPVGGKARHNKPALWPGPGRPSWQNPRSWETSLPKDPAEERKPVQLC